MTQSGFDGAGREPVRREYAGRAEQYDRRWRGYIAATTARTAAALDVAPRQTVLDVGCGSGALLQRVHRPGSECRLIGVDASPPMLRQAREKVPATVTLVAGAADRLPVRTGAIDRLASSSMLHFLGRPDSALAEWARVLKPGGQLVLTDWCGDDPLTRTIAAYLRWTGQPMGRLLTVRQCRRLIDAAGFTNIRIDRFRVGKWGLMRCRAWRA